MLYEQSVNYLFASEFRPPAASFEIDFAFIDDEKSTDAEADEAELAVKEKPPPPTRKVDEDDYDDEDDEAEEDEQKEEEAKEQDTTMQDVETNERPDTPESKSKGQNDKTPESASKSGNDNRPDLKPESRSGTPQRPSTDPEAKISGGIITPADTPSASEERQNGDAMLTFEMNNIYQTLDSDSEHLLKVHKLGKRSQTNREGSPSRENGSGNADAHPPNGQGKLSQINFGAANLSLKHLLAVIDEKRQQLSFSDIELRNLISEVRKNRSKWASEDRVGQEELYEAAEKVVLELRAYTEHSTAFLNKVNKRDAPNYFNIIKHPMDLSTVMKKLKALQYRSKQEFVDDLMLIWNNCLEFNTDPQHYLRKHAIAMKKKTLTLIPLIPDITIKSKAEAESEDYTVTPVPREMSVDGDIESEDGDSVVGNHRSSSRVHTGSKKAPPGYVPHHPLNRREDDTASQAESQTGFRGAAVESEEPVTEVFEYEVVPTVPETLWNVSEKLEGLEHEQFETAVDLSTIESPFVSTKSGLTTCMDANLAELQQIRKVCSKIAVIKRMQQQAHLYSAQLKAYNPEPLVEKDVDMESRLPGHSDLSREVAEACMRRSVAKVAMHTGYEDCQMLAMEGLTSLAGDFMERLGRTLCLYMESCRGVQRYSTEDLILQALYENGIYDLGGLESYYRDDIERFGVKLKDVHERMNMSLADYLRPALAPSNNSDAQFDDGSQEFITGAFSDDIGEDFFGFKELGLDEEFGLSSMSVPLHLLHSRLHASSNVQAAPTVQNLMQSAPPFEPLTMEKIEQQIGLMRDFFISRMEKYEVDGVLLEDEALPPKQRNQRPKLPPTGKIAVVKKRSSENTFAESSKKKKKI
ncbi:hypothetical protein BZA70DRAFT_275004 [Myxozyma melibiosi]|uniref:Bromo domain-containing protein n=1 Tax=Myxozyma melibiosi TaxID=54550 RepID=A0ABR1FA75_9ASCO